MIIYVSLSSIGSKLFSYSSCLYCSVLYSILIHSFIHLYLPLYPGHGFVDLESISGTLDMRWGYTLDGTPVHPMAPCTHTFTDRSNLVFPIHIMILGGPHFDPELGIMSVWSFTCSSCVHVSFLWVL